MIKPINFIPEGSWLTFIKQTSFAILGRNGNNSISKALYKCICGKEGEYSITMVKGGWRLSCGCLRKKPNILNTKHGLSEHPLYWIWAGIKKRCYNENEQSFPDYGGRGVIMCPQWVDNPKSFIEWGLANGWRKGLEIDKDIKAKEMGIPALLYSPEMCLFVTKKKNCNARRSNTFLEFNGISKTLQEWSDEYGIGYSTVSMRINNYGYTVERALTEPLYKSRIRPKGIKYKTNKK